MEQRLAVPVYRYFLILLMLYRPKKAFMQALLICSFIDMWRSNHAPRLRELSLGLMIASPTLMPSLHYCSSSRL